MDIKYNNNSFINSSSIILVPQKSSENNSSESNISSSSINEMILSDNSADKTKSNQALFNNTVSISENDLKISDTDDNSELYVEDEQNDSFPEISTTFKKKSSKGNLIKHCKTHVAINNNEKNSFFYNIKEIKCNNFNTDEKIDYDQKKFHKKKQLPKKIYSFDEGTNVNNSNQDESDISKSFDIINIKKTLKNQLSQE